MRALLAPLVLLWGGCSSFFAPFTSDNPDSCLHHPELCASGEVCSASLGRCIPTDIISPASVGCSAMALITALRDARNKADNVLILTPGCTYNLSTVDNFWYGPNSLPPIASNVTIEGNGATIERDGAAPKMRLFFVAGPPTPTPAVGGQWGLNPGSLTLRNLTLQGGLARGGSGGSSYFPGGGGAGLGGAIFAQGQATLVGVTLTANQAQGGAGGGFTNSPMSTAGGGGLGGDGGANDGGGGFKGNGGAGVGGAFFGGEGGTVTGMAGSGMGVEPGEVGTGAKGGDGGGGRGLGGRGGGNAGGTRGSGNDGGGGGGNNAGGGGGFGGGAGSGSGYGGGGGFGGGGGGTGGTGGSTGGGGGVGGGGGGGGGGGFGGGGGGINSFGGAGGFGGGGGVGGVAGDGGFGGGLGESGLGGGGGAGLGGAVFLMYGSLTVVNSTLVENTASGGKGSVNLLGMNAESGSGLGGAIFNLNGHVTLVNSTLVGNPVLPGGPGLAQGAGGAVYNLSFGNAFGGQINNASLILQNSILADRTDSSSSVSAVVNDQQTGYALVTATAPNIVVSVTKLGTGTVDDSGVKNIPPLLGPIADNGGLTQTLAPLTGSPAVGAADPALCGAAPVGGVDQRGLSRPNSSCSLGAVEAEPVTLEPAPRGPGCAVASVPIPQPAPWTALLLGLPLLLLSVRQRRRG